MRERARGPIVGGLAILMIAAVTGCTASSSPAPSSTPTPTGTPVAVLSFDDGARLDPTQKGAWADPFKAAEGYTVLTTDDGDGSWSYTSEATKCVIGYYAGTLEGMDVSAGDSALSDELLAAQFGSTAEDIAEFAKDGVAPFRTPTELVETRAVAGTDAESATTYIVAARAFAALNQGFVATLKCPAKVDIADEWATLNTDRGAFALVFSTAGG